MAAELGYKDGSIVRTRWGQIRRKKINTSGGSADTPAKATPKKRKGKVESGDGADDEETPKPKRGRKTKAQKAKEEEEGAAAAVKQEEDAENEANAVESTEKGGEVADAGSA